MDNFNELLNKSRELKNESDLIEQDIKMIIDENDRVIRIAKNTPIILDDIDKKFSDVTKLDFKDHAFLFLL